MLSKGVFTLGTIDLVTVLIIFVLRTRALSCTYTPIQQVAVYTYLHVLPNIFVSFLD